MKGPLFPFLLIGVSFGCVDAQDDFTRILAELPSCSVDCIIKGLSAVPNAIVDLMDTCINGTLQASLSACIQGQCNYTEQYQVAIFDNQLCAGVPIPSRAWHLAIVGLVCVPLALLAIMFRCYSRYQNLKHFGWDDWLIVIAGMTLIPLVVLDCYDAFVNGYGRHYWNVDPLRMQQLLKLFYVSEVLYLFVITVVKASILALYFRVFPSNTFRYANCVVMVLVVFAGIGLVAAVLFQCRPVALAWDLNLDGRCVNINKLAYAAGAISVALDFVILILPIPALARLQMGRTQKFNLICMFSLGIIACITSIIRLNYLVSFSKSTDPTWDNVLPAIWSIIEICVAIICACLPGIRGLLSRYLTIFAFSSPHSSDNVRRSGFSTGHTKNSAVEQPKGPSGIILEHIPSSSEIRLLQHTRGPSQQSGTSLYDEQWIAPKQKTSAQNPIRSNIEQKRHETFSRQDSSLVSRTSLNLSDFTLCGHFSDSSFTPHQLSSLSLDANLECRCGARSQAGQRRLFSLTSSIAGHDQILQQDTSSSSVIPDQIWINPKFDGEGNIVEGHSIPVRAEQTWLTSDENPLSPPGSEIDRDCFSFTATPRTNLSSARLPYPVRRAESKQSITSVARICSSFTSLVSLPGPREDRVGGLDLVIDGSKGGSDDLVGENQLQWELEGRERLQMKSLGAKENGGFEGLRGDEVEGEGDRDGSRDRWKSEGRSRLRGLLIPISMGRKGGDVV